MANLLKIKRANKDYRSVKAGPRGVGSIALPFLNVLSVYRNNNTNLINIPSWFSDK